MKSRAVQIGFSGAGVFSLLSTSTAIAKSITQYQTLVQEKLIYIILSLVFIFLIYPKIRSRVSYAFQQQAREVKKNNEKGFSHNCLSSPFINPDSKCRQPITKMFC